MKQVSSMRVGKGFKKTEIGELPADWEVAELIEVCEKPEYGYTSRSITKPVGPKLLRITDIQSGNVNWDSVPFCDCPDDVRERYRLRDGDIVFARTGASTGKSFLLQKCPDAIFASYLIKVTGTKIEPLFLYMYFNSYSYWKQIQQLTVGSAQGGLNANKLSHLKVPFPPIAEQRKIGEILSIVDDAFQKFSGVIEKTKLLKKGMMKRLLTKGIGHTRFRKTAIGRIPAEWKVVALSAVASKSKYAFVDGPIGSNLKTIHYKEDGVPVMQSQSITSGKFIPDDKHFVSESKARELERSLVSGNTMKITPDKSKIEATFLQSYIHFLYEIKYFNKLLGITAQPAITLRDTKKIRIPLPSMTEQQQISSIIISIDEEIDQNLMYQTKLVELKKALMHVLLTGKVRVKV